MWFSGPHAGEFVLTLGGYHPSFHRDGYPVVPRLGFVWTVSSFLVIKGESYFALTSEAMMARPESTVQFRAVNASGVVPMICVSGLVSATVVLAESRPR